MLPSKPYRYKPTDLQAYSALVKVGNHKEDTDFVSNVALFSRHWPENHVPLPWLQFGGLCAYNVGSWLRTTVIYNYIRATRSKNLTRLQRERLVSIPAIHYTPFTELGHNFGRINFTESCPLLQKPIYQLHILFCHRYNNRQLQTIVSGPKDARFVGKKPSTAGRVLERDVLTSVGWKCSINPFN